MWTLLYEYKKSLKSIKVAKSNLSNNDMTKDQLNSELSLLNSMIRSLEEVIYWIEHGRDAKAGSRGVDKTKVYLKPIDIIDVCQKYQPLGHLAPDDIETEQGQLRIKKAFATLTDRERETYVLHYVELLTHEEIADLLGVKRGTINITMQRASDKIKRQVERMKADELCAAHS